VKKDAPVVAGGAGSPFRLRWPAGRREGAGIADLLLAGSVGPRVSRVRFPCVAGEAMAAVSQWNKSSRTLPCPIDAPLRRRWRARGGGAPYVESLYRSLRGLPFCRLRGATVLAARFVKGAEMAAGDAECRGVDRARASLGSSRRRALIQDWRSLGRAPGRRFFNDGIVLASVLSNYYGSIKLLCNGVPPDLGGSGCSRRRRWMVAAFVDEHGGQGTSCDFVFFRGFCAKSLGQLSLFPVPLYLYVYVYILLV
jgi:hypothetical protein